MSATIGKNKPQNAHNLGGLKTVKVSMSPPQKKNHTPNLQNSQIWRIFALI
jgi:hypothetical protein